MYRVTDGKRYIKYSSKFGMFHGRIVVTDRPTEAHLFSRERDARRRRDVLVARAREYSWEEKFAGSWRVEEVPSGPNGGSAERG